MSRIIIIITIIIIIIIIVDVIVFVVIWQRYFVYSDWFLSGLILDTRAHVSPRQRISLRPRNQICAEEKSSGVENGVVQLLLMIYARA